MTARVKKLRGVEGTVRWPPQSAHERLVTLWKKIKFELSTKKKIPEFLYLRLRLMSECWSWSLNKPIIRQINRTSVSHYTIFESLQRHLCSSPNILKMFSQSTWKPSHGFSILSKPRSNLSSGVEKLFETSFLRYLGAWKWNKVEIGVHQTRVCLDDIGKSFIGFVIW